MIGDRPFESGDKAANFWPLAILSFGESWHNSHHADPSCARHGVMKGQIDITARLIWTFEKLGWAWDVRWPDMDKFNQKLAVALTRLPRPVLVAALNDAQAGLDMFDDEGDPTGVVGADDVRRIAMSLPDLTQSSARRWVHYGHCKGSPS